MATAIDSTTRLVSPKLHEVEPSSSSTVIESSSPLPGQAPSTQPSVSKKNWVPNPQSPAEKDRARTLVLCFDGTGDQFDDDNSNVIQFVQCLKKDDQRHQLVYYQAGIGTYSKTSFVSPLTNKIAMTLDEMFAWNLSTHVQDGYEFLMQNYTDGDKISIFGFSRGAYTARALAGMIQKVGLLPAWNTQQIPFAYAMFTREDTNGLTNSESFKATFSTDVTIDFVGVWDTVASVGMVSKELPFVSNNHAIRYFRHALSLDEHRAKFMPNFYHASPDSEPKVAQSSVSGLTAGLQRVDTAAGLALTSVAKDAPNTEHRHQPKEDPDEHLKAYEREINKKYEKTKALEVWFAGCHCDVGGGSVKNNTRHSLARISLRWMIRECFKAKTGIIFDADQLKIVCGMDAETLYPIVRDRPERIKGKTVAIEQTPAQGLAIVTFVKVVADILAIPIRLILNVVLFPFKTVWNLIRFSDAAKSLKKLLGLTKDDKDGKAPAPPANGAPPKGPDFESEEIEELHDAVSPAFDQLKIRWMWWLVEYLPLRHREQEGTRDDYFVAMNRGRGRLIYGDARISKIKVHRSVKTRLEASRNAKSEKTWFSAVSQLFKKKDSELYRPNAFWKLKGADGRKKAYPTTHEEWNVDNSQHWEWVE